MTRGFALLTPAERASVSAKGGRAAQASGHANHFTSATARSAGLASAQRPNRWLYQRMARGDWRVLNVRYPSGAYGRVMRSYTDGKWRIYRNLSLTFRTRYEAAAAEWEFATQEARHA